MSIHYYLRSAILPVTIDLDAFVKHIVMTTSAGVRPVIAGSMGEAIHLSHTERATLIKTARSALDSTGLANVPIIAGIGAGSTRETVELAHEAAAAGADYGMAIISGYFAGALAGDKQALKGYWQEISEKSPIPVLIYNCEQHRLLALVQFQFLSDPAASGGINLDSDIITELAIQCPNLAGVKLTYASPVRV